VVVVGGRDDAESGEVIVTGCGGLNLAGKTTLAETGAVIARSALLLSGDSGVLHIAVGLGIPTVSLFGPGIEAKWGPKGEGDVILNRRLPCSPCTRFGTTPPCPIQARCLSAISVEDVAAAVEKLLGETTPK
jgi:ADP-heptose:LPS heptosyltransferase